MKPDKEIIIDAIISFSLFVFCALTFVLATVVSVWAFI